jgi:trans-2,3-dihydro-3-hydroxyanthranilate isomerase
MRIFTPETEMPIAGHPTIGSTFALADSGRIAPGTPRFVFHLNIGPTPVDLDWDGDRLGFAWMTQPNPVFGPTVADGAQVAAALGLEPGDLLSRVPVQQVSCGVPFLYVPLRDAATVDRAVSDGAALRRLAQSTGLDLPIFLFAPDDARSASRNPAYTEDDARSVSWHRAVTETAARPVVVYSRMFAPALGIPEDPATGIASGPLGCYLVRYGLVDADRAGSIVSRQGVAMGRPSEILMSIRVDGDVISDVKVGGTAVLVARGEFLL